ncbi:MAG TPA: sigma 54-interacting transcriptional regulator, partial [Pyrinomonadaceae bacterium]|nr:sigma 54-interacting transcriptional regulator [Pyrinomonadaceae bacterium]
MKTRTMATPGTSTKMTAEQAEARKLATIMEVGQTLAGTFKLKDAMSRVLETLGRHHSILRGVVLLSDEDTNELRVVASHGLDEEVARRVKYRAGEGITGRVFQTGKLVVVPQVSREPLFLDRLGVRRKTLKQQELTFICIPLLVNRKPVGVLGIDLRYKAERDYERATKFFSIIATMIAQAIKVDHLIESDRQRLLDENIHLKQELRERYDFGHIIGNSGPLRQVYEQVSQVARTNTTVLLRGESGTGKEMIAHAIHYNSLRAGKPFVRVSCAALPETLIESELFGYEKGAFTGTASRKKER